MIALSPSASGTVHVTRADWVAGVGLTPVGADGATAVCGVTAFELADSAPVPVGLMAWTLNV